MQCPVCATLNREQARFCKECGTFLASLCPQCRRELPDKAKFCDACGFRLTDQPRSVPAVPSLVSTPTVSPPPPVPAVPVQAAPPTGEQANLQRYIPKELLKKFDAAVAGGRLTGERRVVTMLFCDVKGSTAAAESLDPEEWTEIINGAFEHMIKPVYQYEGTVARLMGDSILAFFGAPIAHEDDPERAVLAGLDIVTGIKSYRETVKGRYGIDFDVRVGINTGMVVVGTVGSDLRMEYTAMGDAINLAARMEQTALPGTVQIAHDTYRLVAPLFQVEELGGISVKGKAEPVLAYRVIGRKAAPGRMRGIEGLASPLVGRDFEMAALNEIVRTAQRGVGAIISLQSEAGLGKTRLIQELQKKWQATPGLSWYAVSIPSYESSHAYGVFQNFIRQYTRIELGDSPEEARIKLEPLFQGFEGDPRDRATQAISILLGLPPNAALPPLEGEAFRQTLYAVMEAVVRRVFTQTPGVLVIDDLHWSDTASVELLLYLLPLADKIPFVVLYALRPNRQSPSWQVAVEAETRLPHRYTEIRLRPLSEEDSSLMVKNLIGGAEIPDELMTKILERAAGNPFFIEEVVRTLIEDGIFVRDVTTGRWGVTQGAQVFDIPDSLQALLAARIDQLEEMTRRTLQISAVIGRSFYVRVLAAIAEQGQDLERHLSILQRLDMIGEAARLPEIEYRFRNPLTQEVAYQSILLKQRRAFHLQVAEKMQELYGDRLDEYANLLAHHFAVSDQPEQAIAYLRRAARRAVALYAYDDALHYLQSALELMPANDSSAPQKPEVLEEQADIYHLLREGLRAIGLYRQALETWLALFCPDRFAPVRLHRKIVQIVTESKWAVDAATYQQVREIRNESIGALREHLANLEKETPYRETVLLLVTLSMDAWRNVEPPDWETAQHYAQAAVDTAQNLDELPVLAEALGALANVLDGRSLLREHLAVALRRYEITQEPNFGDLRVKIDALRGLGAAYMYVGEYEQALPFLDEVETLAARAQAIDQQTNAFGIRAQCLFRLDRWDGVLKAEEGWRDLERHHARERVGETCFFVALSASVHALRGDVVRAETYRQESFNYMVGMSGTPANWQRNQFY